jgi:C2H2 type zinc-finger (2 copies)/Zinc finger, C2H2 type
VFGAPRARLVGRMDGRTIDSHFTSFGFCRTQRKRGRTSWRSMMARAHSLFVLFSLAAVLAVLVSAGFIAPVRCRKYRSCALPASAPSHRQEGLAGAFECGDCERSFTSQLALQQHQVAKNHRQKSNEVNIHNCGFCERSFSTREALTQHMNAQHAKQISCPACAVTRFRSLTSALQHLESGQCPHCQGKQNARYQVYQAISPHISSHGEPQWLLVGSAVARGVQNADELEEFPYSCDLCDRPFRELNHLLQHKTDKHMGFLWALQQQQQQQLGKPPTMMPLRFLLPNHDHNNRQHNESHESHRYKQYQDWDDYNDYYDDDD